MNENKIEKLGISIKVRRAIKKELEEIKRAENLSSVSDTIHLLLTTRSDTINLNKKYEDIIEKLELIQEYLITKAELDKVSKENLEMNAESEKLSKIIRKYRENTDGLIKDNKTIFNVGDLIKALEKYKYEELVIHVKIEGKERDRILCGNPSIYGVIFDGNAYGINIIYNERDEHKLPIEIKDIKLYDYKENSDLTEDEKKGLESDKGKNKFKH